MTGEKDIFSRDELIKLKNQSPTYILSTVFNDYFYIWRVYGKRCDDE